MSDCIKIGEEKTTRRSLELITLAWVFGAIWQTAVSGSPTTQFLKGLGASNFQFGLFAALPFLASLISLPASMLIEHTGHRKGIFLVALYLQRFMWVPMALAPLWVVSTGGNMAGALWLFIALAFAMYATGAIGNPAWMSWMADTVPDRLRGKYFSRRRQWGILSAIPTALLVGWILDSRLVTGGDAMTILRWCAIIFCCAAIAGKMDVALFHFVPDPGRPRSNGGLLRALREPLKNRQFLWFGGFVATLTFAVSFMGQFTTLYLRDQVYVDQKAASFNTGAQLMLLVGPMAAQLLILPVWGMAVDRMGKRPVLALAGLGLVPVAWGWCMLGTNNIWLGYILAAAGAVLWTGVEIANFNFVLEMAAPGEDGAERAGGSAYVAVNSVIVNIAGCFGGISAGLIAQFMRDWHWTPFAGKTFHFYDVLFVLSGVLRLAAVAVFLPFVHEPTARSTAQALRFISANIYNNVFNAILQPLRFATRKQSGKHRNLPLTPLEPQTTPAKAA